MASFDWNYWKEKYVTGGDEVTLDALANTPDAPKLDTLKKRSIKESWVEQRKQFRRQMHKVHKAIDLKVEEAVDAQVDRLIDLAETIARHIRMSKKLQQIADSAMDSIDPSTLEPRDIVAWVKAGAELERLAIGLSTSKTDINVDVTAMSDEQLELIIAGEANLDEFLQLN